MKKILVIAEKRDAAQALLKFFPGPHVNKGTHFEADNGRIKIGYAQGHLVEQYEPGDYDEKWIKWNIESLPIIPPYWKNKPSATKEKLLKNLKMLISECDEIIHAGDAAREGQLIIDEILVYFNNKKPVKRLWLSAMTQKDFDYAYNNIQDNQNYQNITAAAYGRQRADFTLGMTFTRLLSILFQQQGYNSKTPKSVGRVQTPIVSIVIARNESIKNFKPQSYFTLHAQLQDQAASKSPFWTRWLPAGLDIHTKLNSNDELDPVEVEDEEDEDATALPSWLLKPNRILDKVKADEMLANIKQHPTGNIQKFEKKPGKEKPPKLLDLNELQIAMNKKYGLSSNVTLEIAQSLYQKGWMSYPRTDSRYLPESLLPDIPQMLNSVKSLGGKFVGLVDGANTSQKGSCFNDKEVTDHYALVPTVDAPDVSSMSTEERNVYEYVSLLTLANFYPDCDIIKVALEAEIGGQRFVTTGRSVVNPGWRIVFGKEEQAENASSEEDIELPIFAVGDTVNVKEIKCESGETKPPPYFTEGSLLKALSNVHRLVSDPEHRKKLKAIKGIGRPATRSNMIKNNFDRNYFQLKGNKIMHTRIAEIIVKSLPSELIDPALTARWEQALDSVETKKVTLQLFEERQAAWVKQIFEKAKSTIQIPPPNEEDKAPAYSGGGGNYSKSNTSSKSSSSKTSKSTSKSSSSSTTAKGKACPKCKTGKMQEREIKNGPNAGKKFKGCSNYPKCNHTEWPK